MLILVKKYWWLGLCLLILLGVSGVQAINERPQLQPPTESLIGQVASISGQVRVKPRDQEDDQTIDLSSNLVDGETIITSPSASLSLNFNQIFQVVLNENSELSLSNLIKDSLLVQQRNGTGLYQATADQKLGIRAGRLLILLDSGQVKITQNPDSTIIQILSGQAQLGFVDKSNQTQIKTISSGQVAEFDLVKRTITLL